MMDVITVLGDKVLSFVRSLGQMAVLFWQFLTESVRRPFEGKLITEQVYHIGIRSLSIVIVAAASTGMVMALQFGLGLSKFGGKLYVPKIVSLSIIRELGPAFTSIILAARIGAGIASEIGSMVVTQQIDAIRALGTSPIKKIVIPRVLGCLIAIPFLATIANLVGVAGSLLVGVHELGLDPGFYYEKILATVVARDYLTGIGKTFFFGFFIAIISCYYGMNVRGGTRGVGMATTNAVVMSSITILISDFFLTKLFFLAFERG